MPKASSRAAARSHQSRPASAATVASMTRVATSRVASTPQGKAWRMAEDTEPLACTSPSA